MILRTGYNYDRSQASLDSGLFCPESEAVVQQQFAEEVDINTIVRRFGLTGELPDEVRVPMSGDFTDVMDYKSALDAVRAADAGFMELPAELRARFENDPQRLMMFMADDKNRAEAIALGLVNKAPEKTRDAVSAIDELAARFPVSEKK